MTAILDNANKVTDLCRSSSSNVSSATSAIEQKAKKTISHKVFALIGISAYFDSTIPIFFFLYFLSAP